MRTGNTLSPSKENKPEKYPYCGEVLRGIRHDVDHNEEVTDLLVDLGEKQTEQIKRLRCKIESIETTALGAMLLGSVCLVLTVLNLLGVL